MAVISNLQAKFHAFKAQQLEMNEVVKGDNLGDALNMMVPNDASTLGGSPHKITIGEGFTYAHFAGMMAKNTAAIIAALSRNNGNTGGNNGGGA